MATKPRKRAAAKSKAVKAVAAAEGIAPAAPSRGKGRPPGSKNRAGKKASIKKAVANAKAPIESLTIGFSFDDIRASNLENLVRQEKEVRHVLSAIRKAKAAFGKLSSKSFSIDGSSIKGGVRKPKKRGPKKGFKRGGVTKKQLIINYMNEVGTPVKSGDLIEELYKRSGERNRPSFRQSMFTTLSQIYKSGELVKDGEGVVRLRD